MDTGGRIPFLGVWLLSSAWLVMFLWAVPDVFFMPQNVTLLLEMLLCSHCLWWRGCVCSSYINQFCLGKGEEIKHHFTALLPLSSHIPQAKKQVFLLVWNQPRLLRPILLRTVVHFTFFHLFLKLLSLAEKTQQIVHEDMISEFSTTHAWCDNFFEFPCQSCYFIFHDWMKLPWKGCSACGSCQSRFWILAVNGLSGMHTPHLTLQHSLLAPLWRCKALNVACDFKEESDFFSTDE